MSGCIYLGLQDDPETVLQFVSDGNFCHHASPAATPKPAHQKAFCLTNKHISCPVFLLTEKRPLPADIIFHDYKPNFIGKVVFRGVLLAILLVLVTAAIGRAVGSKGVVSIPSEMLKGTISATSTQLPLVVSTGSMISPTSSILPVTPTATLNSTDPACTTPEGWILYTLLPTDSILRLSLSLGISVTDLQSANCLEDDRVVRPGDQIYIPYLPTSTPTPGIQSPTPTATLQPEPTSSPRPLPSYTYTPMAPTKEPKPKPPSPMPPPSDTPAPVVPTSSPPPPSPMPEPTNTTAPQPATPTSPPPPPP
jgi:hypothetical protein